MTASPARAHAALERRPVADGDAELLFRVYASTRTEELARVAWTEAEKEAFLRMQFAAQDRHYRAHYPGAELSVLVEDGLPAGRLYLYRQPSEIRVMDIALLPGFRGRGLGTRLLLEVLDEARAGAQAVTVHVELFNPALRLYERLGFTAVEDRGAYRLMRWEAGR